MCVCGGGGGGAGGGGGLAPCTDLKMWKKGTFHFNCVISHINKEILYFSFACYSRLCMCYTHKFCDVALPELCVWWLINYDDCDHMFKNFF